MKILALVVALVIVASGAYVGKGKNDLKAAVEVVRTSTTTTIRYVQEQTKSWSTGFVIKDYLDDTSKSASRIFDDVERDIRWETLTLQSGQKYVNGLLDLFIAANNQLAWAFNMVERSKLNEVYEVRQKIQQNLMKVYGILDALLAPSDPILQQTWRVVSTLRVNAIDVMEFAKATAAFWGYIYPTEIGIDKFKAEISTIFDNTFGDLFQKKLTSQQALKYMTQMEVSFQKARDYIELQYRATEPSFSYPGDHGLGNIRTDFANFNANLQIVKSTLPLQYN